MYVLNYTKINFKKRNKKPHINLEHKSDRRSSRRGVLSLKPFLRHIEVDRNLQGCCMDNPLRWLLIC